MAKVNIFIPVYNGEKYLAETVQSILAQTFSDYIAFFVDDGSSDNSVELLKQYADEDNRINVIEKPHEGSVPFAWNHIFPNLEAEWTLYMSHDDILEPLLLQCLVEKQKETEADAVIPSCHFFCEHIDDHKYDAKNRMNDMTERSQSECLSGKDAFELMLDYSIPGFALWRTSLIKRIGMPTESFNSDEGMQRIWVKECTKVAFSSAKFYYRLAQNSITNGLKSYHYRSILTNKRLLEEAKVAQISPIKTRKFQYYCLSSLIYLKSKFKNDAQSFSESEKKSITQIFTTVYPSFSKNLGRPRNLKEVILYFASINRLFFNLTVSAFAGRFNRKV